MKKISIKSKILLIILGLFSLVLPFSCDKTKEINPSKNEEEEVIKLLKEHGFVEETPSSNLRLSNQTDDLKRPKLTTMKQAQKIIKMMEEFEKGGILDVNLVADTLNSKNSRKRFFACDDVGTYYISRAVTGLFSSIDITVQRGVGGNITNVYSTVYGLPFYGYEQQVYTVFNKSEFCIDATVLWGIDVGGLPLGLRQRVSLRVWTYGPGQCQAYVSYGQGRC